MSWSPYRPPPPRSFRSVIAERDALGIVPPHIAARQASIGPNGEIEVEAADYDVQAYNILCTLEERQGHAVPMERIEKQGHDSVKLGEALLRLAAARRRAAQPAPYGTLEMIVEDIQPTGPRGIMIEPRGPPSLAELADDADRDRER